MFLIGKPKDRGHEYEGMELENMVSEPDTEPNKWICYGKAQNGDLLCLIGYEDLERKELWSVRKIA